MTFNDFKAYRQTLKPLLEQRKLEGMRLNERGHWTMIKAFGLIALSWLVGVIFILTLQHFGCRLPE